MKPSLALALVLIVFVGCQSPVSSATTVTGSSTLPLGSAAGVGVYAADASGYGVLYYGSTATNWVSVDWSKYYTSSSRYSTSMTYPPVHDVTTDSSGTLYAATSDGLLIGKGTSCVQWWKGTTVYGVTVTTSGVYASTATGLYYSTTPTTGGWTAVISSTPVFQWAAKSSTGVACTSLGLYSSSTPTTASSYSAVSGLNSNSPNSAYLSGSTLYVGTPVGLSTSTNLTTWTNSVLGFGVNGVLSTTINSTATLLLATTTGISYSQNSGSSWSTLVSGVGVNNIVVGANTATYYYANGTSGLGILQVSTSGSATISWVLTWANIVKVFVASS